MRRPRRRTAFLLLAFLALGACGTGSQVRPMVASTYPAQGQVLMGPLEEIRVTYDMPVRFLNTADVRVFTEGGSFLDARASQRAGEPESIYLRPAQGGTFPLGTELGVLLIEGLVVNDGDHYAEQPFSFSFEVGTEPPLPVGRPGRVTLLDSTTFAVTDDKATPGGRDPVGIVSTIHGTTRRVWVQLTDGAGGGDSMGWFEPGAPFMGIISLPAVADLTSDADAITVDPDGTYVYAAYRDTDSQGIRLVRINPATAAVAGFLDLASITAGPSTEPVSVTWSRDGDELVIAAAEGATGRLAFVERESFTEIDRDGSAAGTQGFALPNGAGRVVAAGDDYWVALPGTNDLDKVSANTGTVTASPGTETGTDAALLAMPDGEFIVQGLAGYADDLALQVRSAPSGLDTPGPSAILDDVGGVDRLATSVVTAQHLPGFARFAVLLDSPAGLLLARFEYLPHLLLQEDLDALTLGAQVADVEAAVPGATVLGRTYGAFAPFP